VWTGISVPWELSTAHVDDLEVMNLIELTATAEVADDVKQDGL
jgi:hypothetical protein